VGNGKRLWIVLAAGLIGLALIALWQGDKLGRGTKESVSVAAPSNGSLRGAALETPGGLDATGGALGTSDDYGRVPDFHLVSQTGDSVRLADLAGRPWIGDFIFTNCTSSCPMMTAQLQRLDKALGDEDLPVRLVSFSVDPEHDTPAKLADYAKGYGAKADRWLFLTGDKVQLRKLSTDGFHLPASDVSPEEAAQGVEAVLHSTRLVLVDAQGHIRGYYDGTDAKAMEQLGQDLRRLLAS
jgi:cytochrome oxidase Cu insertion factor (SCO1/SenC/PrrC family)